MTYVQKKRRIHLSEVGFFQPGGWDSFFLLTRVQSTSFGWRVGTWIILKHWFSSIYSQPNKPLRKTSTFRNSKLKQQLFPDLTISYKRKKNSLLSIQKIPSGVERPERPAWVMKIFKMVWQIWFGFNLTCWRHFYISCRGRQAEQKKYCLYFLLIKVWKHDWTWKQILDSDNARRIDVIPSIFTSLQYFEIRSRLFLCATIQFLHLTDNVLKIKLSTSREKLGHFQSYYFYYVLLGILVLQQYILYINGVSFFFDVYAPNAVAWFEVTYNQLTWRLLVKNKMFKNNLTQFCWIS